MASAIPLAVSLLSTMASTHPGLHSLQQSLPSFTSMAPSGTQTSAPSSTPSAPINIPAPPGSTNGNPGIATTPPHNSTSNFCEVSRSMYRWRLLVIRPSRHVISNRNITTARRHILTAAKGAPTNPRTIAARPMGRMAKTAETTETTQALRTVTYVGERPCLMLCTLIHEQFIRCAIFDRSTTMGPRRTRSAAKPVRRRPMAVAVKVRLFVEEDHTYSITFTGICRAPGCQKPTYTTSNGTQSEFCSLAHKTYAVPPV